MTLITRLIVCLSSLSTLAQIYSSYLSLHSFFPLCQIGLQPSRVFLFVCFKSCPVQSNYKTKAYQLSYDKP